MWVGVCKLSLLATHSHSLKEKRSVIRTLKDRVRSRFDVRMSEVGDKDSKDSWQHIVLGFAVVSGSRRHAEDGVEKVVAYVDGAGLARVIADRREVLAFTDDSAMASPSDSLSGWIPDQWAGDVGGEEPGQLPDESLDETVDLDDEDLP